MLAAAGTPVRAVVRSVEKYAGRFPPDTEVVAGDVTDEASLQKAFAGCKGVIFAASASTYWKGPKDVDYLGVQKTALAAKGAEVERVVLVSSRLVNPTNRFHPIRILLNNIKWGLMDNKFLGEEALRNSGQDYCIVRPGGLTGGDNQRKANSDPGMEHIMASAAEGDVGNSSSIHRTDVASVVVEALNSGDAKNKTVEIVSRPRLDTDPDFKAHVAGLFAVIGQ
jgi:uncharacterized protein YbjT (DUF2867 family)